MSNKRIFALLLLILLFLFMACTPKAEPVLIEEEKKIVVEEPKKEEVEPSADFFTLLITRDYGRTILEEREVCAENKAVLNILHEIFPGEIETAYGGSYLCGIKDLKATRGYDWFFYVNGFFADVGALDYFPTVGEKIWWDYHQWRIQRSANALIGCYPEPFLHGYQGKIKPTKIVYTPTQKAKAFELLDSLKSLGVQEIDSEIFAAEFTPHQGPRLVIGKWSDLENNNYLQQLNQGFQKNGFLHFTGASLHLYDYQGEKLKELSGDVGVIVAFAAKAADLAPLWLISGLNEKGVEKACNLLINTPEKIKGWGGVVLFDDGLLSLPLLN